MILIEISTKQKVIFKLKIDFWNIAKKNGFYTKIVRKNSIVLPTKKKCAKKTISSWNNRLQLRNVRLIHFKCIKQKIILIRICVSWMFVFVILGIICTDKYHFDDILQTISILISSAAYICLRWFVNRLISLVLANSF